MTMINPRREYRLSQESNQPLPVLKSSTLLTKLHGPGWNTTSSFIPLLTRIAVMFALGVLIKALKTLVWHLSREPMKETSSFEKKSNVWRTCPTVLTGHVLRRLDLSNMTHHRLLVRGDDYALISELSGEKWLLSFTFGPASINGRCIGYILPDYRCMNRTR